MSGSSGRVSVMYEELDRIKKDVEAYVSDALKGRGMTADELSTFAYDVKDWLGSDALYEELMNLVESGEEISNFRVRSLMRDIQEDLRVTHRG